MKPYYCNFGVTIYLGRAEDFLPALPRQAYKTLIFDPPFTYDATKISEVLKPFDAVLTEECSLVIPEQLKVPKTIAFGHPNARDLARMVELIAPTEGVVFDPYMGSGTSLVAARILRRDAVGIEIEEKHCKMAAYRLDKVS